MAISKMVKVVIGGHVSVFDGLMEGVAQAGALGLVFFGIPALLLLFITRRLVLKDSK